jgi:hypothetical protein
VEYVHNLESVPENRCWIRGSLQKWQPLKEEQCLASIERNKMVAGRGPVLDQ